MFFPKASTPVKGENNITNFNLIYIGSHTKRNTSNTHKL